MYTKRMEIPQSIINLSANIKNNRLNIFLSTVIFVSKGNCTGRGRINNFN